MENYSRYARVIAPNTEESLSKIVAKVTRNSTVLDVGCSTGMLGHYLTLEKGCTVDGVDVDDVALQQCGKLYRKTACKNLESEDLTDVFDTASYDYIVVADVVEHLVNPDKLFSQLRLLVKPNGLIIFSIPNITHLAAGLELLLGNFSYKKNGLLDSTHLRFYSYQSIITKFINSGLHVWEVDSVRKDMKETEFENTHEEFFPQSWLDALIDYRSDALIYQWIFSTKTYPNANAVGLAMKEKNNIKFSLMAESYGKEFIVLNQSISERDGLIANLNQSISERDGLIANLNQSISERDGLIANLNQSISERDSLIANLSRSIIELRLSTSWRVTVPLRFLSSNLQKVRSVFSILPQVLQQGGGLWATISKTVDTLRNEGVVGARVKLRWFFARQQENSYVQSQAIDPQVSESIENYRQYEEQHDYSSSIVHPDVKILSYYLPQFHPIPENDLWHGKGFTEWTKVSASAPLFEGHYQQHIPHPDIGYYLLDSADTLRIQAGQMQKAGVHGQVFYHYWFTGKLILEEPAQLLLNTPDIQMPFCFCWANENWTRRWDGNENEILLGQNYSAQDAHEFIRYLIPFFKDPRYIKVEDRPMLLVYRPSSIPNSQEYLDIWGNECAKAGLKRPYVVAVLTRGAVNPNDFGMDAAVERVLHDWTGGAVPEIKNSLRRYLPINGSVLSYEGVADFYMKQADAKSFTYFRSLVPIWDNTARYGSEAYLLHGSSPQRFQEWMENTIAYTQSTLPSDRRFVLVNAWNEWAEGAHLEPDTRYGYSYLNAVGRSLSGVPYEAELNPSCPIPANTKVHLFLPDFVLKQLESDVLLKQRFVNCLSRSSIFDSCVVSINVPELIKYLPIGVKLDLHDANFILEFRKVAYFDSTVIERMLQAACVSGSAVIANSYGEDLPLIEVTENGSVDACVAYTMPLLLTPKAVRESGYKNFRMRTDARCFVATPCNRTNYKKPVVTTIIRFHKSADLKELKNALYCLYAMRDCVVVPLIATQDLSTHQMDALQNTLSEFEWAQEQVPQIHTYRSQEGSGDLRSKMLNESLKKVQSRYAAFLDFDDLLMSNAYSWLIERLEKTGKAVSFGRVYSASFDSASELIKKRTRVYEYGYSYEEFFGHNHAPLHSFMLDMDRINLNELVYFEDQRYMEDYLLTLQLFTKDNCDWDSLKYNFYIGDYIHSTDRSHTLASLDEQERKRMLSNPEYRICEQRIVDMRIKIKNTR